MKRPKATAVALSLILSINMLGCTKQQNKKIETSNDDFIEETFNHCYVTVFDSVKKIVEETKYLVLCDNITPVYNYEEYYITEEEIDAIVSNATKVTTCDNEDNDIFSLINQIDSNTESYIKDKENLLNAFHIGDAYENIDEEKFKEMIYEAILESLYDEGEINLEYYCKLKDIKIVIDKEDKGNGASAYFVPKESNSNNSIKDKDTLVLCLNTIIDDYQYYLCLYQEYNEIYDDPSDIYHFIKEYILKHELNHVNQIACNCRIEKGQTYLDISTLSLNSSDNSDLPGRFLIEASAESNLYLNEYDYKHDGSYVYDSLRDKEVLILLLSLFSDNEIEVYYDAIKDSDLPKLYDFLGINTKNDFYSFYKILYQIDSTYGFSSFLNNFISENERENFTVGKAMEIIGDAAYTDLYKLFIKNAMEYTNTTDNFSLEDNLFLYELGRAVILNYSTKIEEIAEGEYKYVWNADRVKEFLELDDIYKSYLVSHYEISYDDLEQSITESIRSISYNSDFKRKMENKFSVLKPILFKTNIYVNIFEDYEKAVNGTESAYTYSLK